jgi:hypothetical protein
MELQSMAIEHDLLTAATTALMDRFNEVFLRHDPATLSGIIAENCVIDKISPDPDGGRCVGRDACVALWTEIATSPALGSTSKEPSRWVTAQ